MPLREIERAAGFRKWATISAQRRNSGSHEIAPEVTNTMSNAAGSGMAVKASQGSA
jgi:hypothetical protein